MSQNTCIYPIETLPISQELTKIYSLSGEICFRYTKTTLFKIARFTYDLLDSLAWLITTDTIYTGDKLIVEE